MSSTTEQEEVHATAPVQEQRYCTGAEFQAFVEERRAAQPDGSIFDMDIEDIIADIEGRS